MTSILFDDLLASENMPSPPIIVSKVLALADDPNSSLRDFSNVICSDVGLAVQLVKVANSACYAVREPVADIDRAVNVIGLSALIPLVVSFSMKGFLAATATPLDLNHFWKRSVLLSSVSAFLSEHSSGVSREGALLAGLLQDFGVLAVSSIYTDEYKNAQDFLSGDHEDLIAFEQAIFGTNHSVVGSALLASWGFPLPITDAILCSHKLPSEYERGLSWCVSGSNIIADEIIRGMEEGDLLRGIYKSLAQSWLDPLHDIESAVTTLLHIISDTSNMFEVDIVSNDLVASR